MVLGCCCLAKDDVFCDVPKGDVAMSTVLKVVSLTGVCIAPVVAAPSFVGMDAVGGSNQIV